MACWRDVFSEASNNGGVLAIRKRGVANNVPFVAVRWDASVPDDYALRLEWKLIKCQRSFHRRHSEDENSGGDGQADIYNRNRHQEQGGKRC